MPFHSFRSIVRRAAAIAALASCAVNAHARCVPVAASASSSAIAVDGEGYLFQGGAASASSCFSSSPQSLAQVYLPYFSDMAIANIEQSPAWTHDVEATNDLFHIGGGVIRFTPINPGSRAPLFFDFTSAFAPIAAPSLLASIDLNGQSFSSLIAASQDFSMPGSPKAIATGFAAAVPEPSSAAMLAAGLGLIGLATSRRQRGAQEKFKPC